MRKYLLLFTFYHIYVRLCIGPIPKHCPYFLVCFDDFDKNCMDCKHLHKTGMWDTSCLNTLYIYISEYQKCAFYFNNHISKCHSLAFQCNAVYKKKNSTLLSDHEYRLTTVMIRNRSSALPKYFPRTPLSKSSRTMVSHMSNLQIKCLDRLKFGILWYDKF